MRAIYDMPAPAKLNLFLHVIGRRPDGYHLLQSVFILLDWYDTLHFEQRYDGQIQRHDLGLPLPPEDLCIQAARALQQAAGVQAGVDISIHKQIPWGAGLGGGSSDAATTLLALNRLWQINWPYSRLQQLALTLGADVPFFIHGETAWVEGIGEQLIALPSLCSQPLLDLAGAASRNIHPASKLHTLSNWFAVVKPPIAIPTKEIFNSQLLVRDTKPVIVMDFLAAINSDESKNCNADRLNTNQVNRRTQTQSVSSRQIKRCLKFGRNDLQKPAEAYSSQVTQALELLATQFGNSRMTGSGSAVFADLGIQANNPPNLALPVLPAGWVGRMCRRLEVHPLKDWISRSSTNRADLLCSA